MMDEETRRQPGTWMPLMCSLSVCLLMISTVAACSKKSVISKSTQTESRPSQDAPPMGSRGSEETAPALGEPHGLRGFTPNPPEEPTRFSPGQPLTDEERPAPSGRSVGRKLLATVYFELNKSSLSEDGRHQLAPAVEFLHRNPGAGVVIEGHCDERGTHEYNLLLGERRAQEVRKTLTKLRVTNRMRTKSLGKEQPVCAEHSDSCHSKNRRAHVLVEQRP